MYSGKNILKGKYFRILRMILLIQLSWSSVTYASDISVHGFLQGNYSVDTAESNPDGGDFKWAEERVQLRLDAAKEPFRLFIKTDAFL